MFIVTNSVCFMGVYGAFAYPTKEEAEYHAEKINVQAGRGMRPFADIYDLSKVPYNPDVMGHVVPN